MILNINGRDYELKYTMNTLDKMYLNGLNVFEDLNVLTKSPHHVIKSFRYGLLEQNNKITDGMAGKLINAYIAEGNSIADVMNIITTAVVEDLGIDTDDAIESNEENNLEESEEGK